MTGLRFPIRRLMLPLALLTVFGCSHIGRAPIGEVAELFTMGRSRQLRDPLREIRNETRVLIIALDGVGRDALYEAIDSGRMPNLARTLGRPLGDGSYEHAYAAPDVLSVLPSTTVPAWAALFTGEPPAVNGVPGNEWFDREEGTFNAPVPATVKSRSHATKLITDEFLSERIRTPTVYERLPDLRMHVSVLPVYRGADLVTFPDPARFGDLVGATIGETLVGDVSGSERVARELDETAVGNLVHVAGDVGLPDLQTVYFNGIDLMTHYADDPEQDQQRYLQEVTDPLIGQVLDLYRATGVLDRTYLVVVADHGHTAVLPEDRNALSMEGADEPPAVLERAGFRLRPWEITAGEGDFQAAFAYQGFAAFVYLADRSTCPAAGDRCDWARPPRFEEDLLPALRAFHTANVSGDGVPAMRGTMDLVLARDPEVPGRYLAFDGDHLMPLREHLAQHPRPELLRLEERLEGLAAGPTAHLSGDLLLLTRTGEHRPIEERYYFGEPMTSEHGGAHASDSRIPLIVAHPGTTGGDLREQVRRVLGQQPTQLRFPPLIAALLEGS